MAEGKPQNARTISLATSLSQLAKSFSCITQALGYLAKGFYWCPVKLFDEFSLYKFTGQPMS